MYRFPLTHALLCSITLHLLCSSVFAHSFLVEPRAYNNTYQIGFAPNGCKPFECPPCPVYKPDHRKTKNTLENPEATWQRGQKVRIRWARNNHRGGMIRMAIVPFEKIFDHGYHQRAAFYYGCWEQNEHKCDTTPCGKDKRNILFQREVTVPPMVPDGVYVLAWAWFGGLNFTEKVAKFADYYSCSFIRISGGIDQTDSFQPFFDAGNDSGKCLTGNTELGTCTQQNQCFNKPVMDVPSVFQNGNKPPVISKDLYTPPYPSFPTPSPPIAYTTLPTPSALIASTMSPSPSKVESPSPSQFGMPNHSHSSIPNPSPSENLVNPPFHPGEAICAGPYCCPVRCGKCGGPGCSGRLGGPINCCTKYIERLNRDCNRVPPPCKF